MASSTTFQGNEIDPIRPVGIDHSVHEIWANEARQELEQRYNFLDYHFEQNSRYCRARAYLEEPDTVTLYGPFVARGSLEGVTDASFLAAVRTYLSRRFVNVQTL